jgi:low affinity Fe/Cu permease
VTHLMVFEIQNTQNRDYHTIQTKLDERIIHVAGTDNRFVLADLSDKQLALWNARFERLANGRECAALPKVS